MIRTILTILITGFLGLLILSFVMPEEAKVITGKILGTVSEVKDTIPEIVTGEKNDTGTQSGEEEKPKGEKVGDRNAITTANVVEYTNNERIKEGLVPLKTNETLNASAKLKVEDMIKRQYFEHVSPTGEGVSDLGRKAGYDYIVMGENLALGNFGSAQDLVTAWMNSPGHRANIVSTGYQEIGVYAARGKYEGREVWFAVQHFGTARGACPAINEKLKTIIDTTNESLRIQEKDISTKRAALESENRPKGQEYEKLVTEFNALVAKYNADLATLQKNITSYNAQVKAFNNCLAMYQK